MTLDCLWNNTHNTSSWSNLPNDSAFFHLYQSFIFLSVVLPWLSVGCGRNWKTSDSTEVYSLFSLFFAQICGLIWATLPVFRTEAFVWTAFLASFCLFRALYSCYQLRPVMFDPEIEEVYIQLFKPLRLSVQHFRAVLSCMRGICNLAPGEELVSEKITRVDTLSLVISGRLLVTQCGKALHFVPPHQFVDSPEWFSVTADEYFQISATALEDSKVLIWHRDRLKLTLMKDQFLQTTFEHIIGRDVVKKLTQSQQDGIPTDVKTLDYEEKENDKMWLVSKVGNATTKLFFNGVTDASQWSLSRISEHDDETTV